MLGSSDKYDALASVRSWLDSAMFPEVIDWLLAQRKPQRTFSFDKNGARSLHSIRDQLFPSLFPRKFGDIAKFKPLPEVEPKRELLWAKALLLKHAGQVRSYVTFRSQFEVAALSGAYSEALQILSSLEEELGYSLWATKLRIATIQVAEGLESQKKYAAEVKRLARRPGVISYIVHQVSVRNEPSVSPERFIDQLSSQITTLKLPSDLRAFVHHHVVGGRPSSYAAVLDTLRHATACSLVDCYEAIVDAARYFADASSFSVHVGRTIAALSEQIPDPRLLGLSFSLRSTTDMMIWRSAALEQWTSGDETAAAAELARELKRDYTRTDLHELAARFDRDKVTTIISSLGTESIAAKLIDGRRKLLHGESPLEQAASDLTRIARNFSTFPWADTLEGFVAAELAPLPRTAPRPISAAAEKQAELVDSKVAYSMSHETALTPIFLPRLNPASSDRYRSALQIETVVVAAGENQHLLAEPSTGNAYLNEELACLSRAEAAVLRHDWGVAIQESTTLSQSGHPFFRTLGCRLLPAVQMRSGSLGECIQFLSRLCVENENARHLLPIGELMDRVDKRLKRQMGGDISLAILLDLFSRYYAATLDQFRRRAYERVLNDLGVTRPTQLRTVNARINPSELIYYLRHLCLPEIMYASPAYVGSRELQEERIAVLQWLVELDPTEEARYSKELVERTRALVLQARRVEVEQSRIQVDAEAFRRSAEQRLRQTFERFVAFRQGGINGAELRGMFADALQGDASRLSVALSTPDNESADLFGSMVLELRDEFAIGKNSGLDGFLSTRIRHGALASELRAPLLNAHVVTKLDETAGDYRANDHWLGQLRLTNSALSARLDSHLKAFARGYDNLLSEIATQWIQVKRTPADRGLIDLSITAEQLRVIAGFAGLDASFEAFADTVFDNLMGKLEMSIAIVRERIQNVAVVRAENLLTQLQRALARDSGDQYDVAPLISAIQEAGTAVQTAFDRVASWFTLSSAASSEPLPVKDAIAIATEVASRLYPGFAAEIELGEAADVSVEAEYVQLYFYIFLTLFENAARHSGAAEGPRVAVGSTCDDGGIVFDVRNPVIRGMDQTESEERLVRIRMAIKESRYFESVSTEGRSGFLKIYKMIKHDFLRPDFDPALDARFDGDQAFHVRFRLPR
ncbi:MAG: hypothetical protein V4617_02675 [Gemmatimonadota bacterium]